VGAGPAGATAAYHLAQAGLDVLLLEKTAFPREKVCGDGLTPRAVTQLVRMGIDTGPEAGWLHNRGLRIVGGRHRLELEWPELASHPSYGLVRRRTDFDEILARQAQKAGARLQERTSVTGAVRDERSGRAEPARRTRQVQRPVRPRRGARSPPPPTLKTGRETPALAAPASLPAPPRRAGAAGPGATTRAAARRRRGRRPAPRRP